MRLIAFLAPFAVALGTLAAEPAAKPAKPTAEPAAKAAPKCTPKVFGRGLDRKVVCVFETEIEVKAGTPKPGVVYVTNGGKAVTGRPRSEDRLKGLSPRLR